jgi:hypothetical protein
MHVKATAISGPIFRVLEASICPYHQSTFGRRGLLSCLFYRFGIFDASDNQGPSESVFATHPGD